MRQRELLAAPGVRLLANSERSRSDVCGDYGIPHERVELLHSGVDLRAFQPRDEAGDAEGAALRRALGVPPGALAVAFVGSGFARKGLAFALAMLARARRSGTAVELLVAGRGAQAPYRRLAERLGVAPALHFLGRVERVATVYAACDAFALPSLYEPFSNAALEALACGLPVLLTAESGVAEVCRDGREGCLLASPDDVEGGAAFLCGLAADAEARQAMGRRARRCAERLDLERHVDEVLALYAR